MNKTYVGISRDHSGSMYTIARAAARDYNSLIQTIRDESHAVGQDTIVNVVECASRVTTVIRNSSANALQPLSETGYRASGSTALFDSVGELISQFESSPDINNKDVGFLVMAITDGGENDSTKWSGDALANKIRQLQSTDRWTFVFRVPRGYSYELTRFGIPAGNILEWDQTDQGVAVATTATTEAFRGYYAERSMGKTSTQKFYANMADVSLKDVKKTLTDISPYVNLWYVYQKSSIRPFCELKSGKPFVEGAAFYQLMKVEDAVQDYKQVVVRHKPTGAIYGGASARQMLGLPTSGTIRVHPGDHGDYEIFLQSTSVNRILPAGTQLLYWPGYNQPIPVAPATKPATKKAPVKGGTKILPITSPQASNLPKPKAAPKATFAGTSAGVSQHYIDGYIAGFEIGKAKGAGRTTTIGTADFRAGYAAGYKDGRGKQKRLYK